MAEWTQHQGDADVVLVPRKALQNIVSVLAAVDSAERAIWVTGSLYTYIDMLLHQQRKENLS